MHKDSFLDDPTRLLRLLRYGPRLGFSAEPKTELLARAAIMAGAPRTVSGPRIRDELLDLLGERTAVWSIDAMSSLGLDRGLHPQFNADEYHAGRAMLELQEGVQQDLLLLAVCCRAMDSATLATWLDYLGLPASARNCVYDAALNHQTLRDELSGVVRPSEVASVLNKTSPETAALAASLSDTPSETRTAIRAWFDHRNREYLLISGGDLRGAGIAEGPAIGRALAAVLARAIDGELDGRDAQLTFGLTVARQNDDDDDPN